MKNVGAFSILFLYLIPVVHAGGFISDVEMEGYPQKITKTVQGIRFDSNYDNGSLQDVKETGADTFECLLFTEIGEIGPKAFWFRFRMKGVAGRSITLLLNHRTNPRPVISLDGKNWRRLTEAEAPSTRELVLSFAPDENEAELAFFFPLGVEETYNRVKAYLARTREADWEIIGQSFEGRDMGMVTVGDPPYPNYRKHRVWVQSRAHAGEATAAHTMLGFLDMITSNAPEARLLRQNCIFHIIPIINVDGVYLGLSRWDSQGIDPEHIWANPCRIPETTHTREKIDLFMRRSNPIEVSLNLHSTERNASDTFFVKHDYPSVTKRFEEIQQRYIDALDHATPLFENLSPSSSQLHESNYLESYFWSNWGEKVMAMTHEGHFYRRACDDEWITDADYRALGRAMALALIEYFDLAEETVLSENPFWMLF